MNTNQTTAHMTMREQMSALVDGQLHGDELAQALQLCTQDPEAMRVWREYHLIGDVLHSSQTAEHNGPTPFLRQLRERMAQQGDAAVENDHEVSNDGAFRWKLTACAASMVAVAAVAWSLAGNWTAQVQPQLAQMAPAHNQQMLISSEQGTMVRNIRLEELLLAHQEFSPTSNAQVPTDFVKQATFDPSVKP